MPQGSNILDPHRGIADRKLVQGDIDPKIFNYFFRHCLTGDRGPRQAMICTFFQRFYEACVLEGIAPVWDETNEQRINDVLMRLNFIDVSKLTKGAPRGRRKSEQQSE
jgi:hypothetical protein